MNFTPEQVAAHFREWADLVKSTYNHSNRQIAEKIGVSRSTFDNIYYETANAKRASRDPKYLVALAFCYPDILKSKALELGLDVPDPPSTKEESKELDLLKQQVEHYQNLLESYKLSNESLQGVIQKLAETIDKQNKEKE